MEEKERKKKEKAPKDLSPPPPNSLPRNKDLATLHAQPYGEKPTPEKEKKEQALPQPPANASLETPP